MVGRLEVFCGPMFAGKTTLLIQRLRRSERARLRVVGVKPAVDSRYSVNEMVTHAGLTFHAGPVNGPEEILARVWDADVIGFDEVQFFDVGIVDVIRELVSAGKRCYAAGLDLDFAGNHFETTGRLACLADEVVKISAVCVVCGADATRTQRVVHSDEVVLIGGSSAYEARCLAHWSRDVPR